MVGSLLLSLLLLLLEVVLEDSILELEGLWVEEEEEAA